MVLLFHRVVSNYKTLIHGNHCVNHYGLDLCACGSGESPEECTAGFDECGNPYETLGESVKFNFKI